MKQHRRSALKVLLAGLVMAAASTTSPSPAPAAEVALGAGSSFSALIVNQWRADAAANGIDINYQDTGSSQGRTLYLQGQVDFAMSDITFQPEDRLDQVTSNKKNFKYITLVAGAMAFAYNVKDLNGQQVTRLNLTPQLACRLFTEKDMKWNDPALQQINPQAALPDAVVRPVVRSDGSGTTFVLMEYCIATAPQVWAAFVQRAGSVAGDDRFRNGQPISVFPPLDDVVSQPLSSGVAKYVANASTGQNSITYVEAGTATGFDLPKAWVSPPRNPSGFVEPTPAGITRALGFADPLADGTFKLDFFGNDPAAYFPSSYSYMIVQTTGLSPGKGETLAKFIYYALGNGQRRNEPLEYAKLSPKLIEDGLKTADALPGSPGRGGGATTTTTRAAGTTTTTRPTSGSTTTVAGGGNVTTTTRASAPAPGQTTTTRAGAAAITTTTRAGGGAGGTATTRSSSGSVVTVPPSGEFPAPDPLAPDAVDPGTETPEVPVEPVPGEEVPVEEVPVGEVPVEEAPVDGLPVEDPLGIPSETVLVAGPPLAAPVADLPTKPGPSNADAVFTLLQGAAIVGAVVMLNRARTRAAT